MKRAPLFGLAFLLLCAGLAACSPFSSSASLPQLNRKEPVILEVWHYYNGPQKAAFDELVTAFNESVGLEEGIVVQGYGQGNVTDLINAVIDAANKKVGAGKVPDIFAAYADTAYAVDQLGLVASLDTYLTEEELAEYRPEFIEEGRISQDGALKIFPIAKSIELLFINTTDWTPFAAATGYRLEDLGTLEGLAQAAEAYYLWTDAQTPEIPEDGKALFGRDAMANYCIIGSQQLGVELFSGYGGQGVITTDKAVFRSLWDQYYVPFINGYYGAFGRFRSDDAKIGKLISFVGSSTSVVYFPDRVAVSDVESYPIECSVLPAPMFAAGKQVAIQQGAGMAVTKSDPKTEYAATIFLKWFTEAEHNIRFAVSSGYLPVKQDALQLDKINEVLAGWEDQATAERMSHTFAAALEQIGNSTLYASKAFEGGTQARMVLEQSLNDQAKADREKVLELMAQGISRASAVAQFNTDANFGAWHEQICKQLMETLPAGPQNTKSSGD